MAINTQNYDAVIDIGARLDEKQLYNQVASLASRLPTLRLKTQNFGSLGSFSKSSDEFQRSLQASSARVLAFSATASQLYIFGRALREVVTSTVEVEKALTDINVVLGLSKKSLAGFSNELFSVANQTGQSFDVAAKAALEFSRQGLSVEQTLKRTADALTLTRLSGLDVAKSVETITAALNGFNDVTLTSEKLINKLATVDAAFAVSTADLANAFQRVGSTASDTGVQLDSLIALVTSAQQTTARGGSVIGNALKTIFQRIQRPEVLDTLREFNVRVEDSQGVILGADTILKNLAKTYETASVQQRNFIVGLAAGVFQSNQFRAILGDLSKENSIYSQALTTSANATDAAAKRQAELNKTLAASLQVLFNQITQASSKVGDLTIKPVIENITGLPGFLDRLTGTFGEEAQNAGLQVGTGILKGLGSYLSGPGILAAAVLATKLFGNFAGFALKSFGSILEATGKQYQTTQAINNLLSQQPQLLSAITSGALSETKAQEAVLNVLRQQNLELARRGQVGQAIKGLVSSGAVRVAGDNIVLAGKKTKSSGYIPEVEEKLGAYAGGYTPGQVKPLNIPKLGKVYYNTAETVKKFPQFEQPAILPPLNSKAGRNYKKDFITSHGFNPYANEGLVPNFSLPNYYENLVGYTKKIKTQDKNWKGFRPPLSGKDVGKYVIVYKDENTLVKGTVLYDKKEKADELVNLMSDSNVIVKQISFGGGEFPRFNSSGFTPDYNKGLIPNYASGLHGLKIGINRNFQTSSSHAIRDVMAKQRLTETDLADIAKFFQNPVIDEKRILRSAPSRLNIPGEQEIEYIIPSSGESGLRGLRLKLAVNPAQMDKSRLITILPRHGVTAADGLVPNFAKFDTNLLKQITQEYNIFGKKLDIKSRNQAQIRTALSLGERTKVSAESLLGDKYFQDEFRKFVPLNKGFVPNYALSFGALKGIVKEFKKLPLSSITRIGDDPYASTIAGSRTGAIVNIPRGVSGEVIAHEIGHVFGGYNNTASDIFGEQLANQGALSLLRKVGAKPLDIKKYKDLAEQNIKNYKINYLKNKIDRNIGIKSGPRLIELLSSQIDNELLPKVVDTKSLGIVNRAHSHNLSKTIKFSGKDKVTDLVKKLKEDSSFFNITLGASAYNKGLVPNFNALSQAITRENQAGVPKSLIKIGQSPILKNKLNPAGLGVYNLRDEPLGLNQGIQRVANQGLDPKRAGIPNFAPQYFSNIRETINDPFNRPQATKALGLEESIKLESEISKFKEQIKKGLRTQQELASATQGLKEQFNLTESSTKKINQRLQQSIGFANRKPFRSNLSGQTGDLSGNFGNQLGFNFSKPPTQGEFLPITQQSLLQTRNRDVSRLTTQFQSQILSQLVSQNQPRINYLQGNELSRVRASISPTFSGGTSNDALVQKSEERKRLLLQRRQEITANIEANNRLQKLQSQASGFGGLFGVGKGGQAIKDLSKSNPDVVREIKQGFQNKAFLASIVGPILGGVAQETFGDKSVGARTAGQAAAGFGNAAGFAATGFALGGGLPGAAIGGAIGIALELPKIIKAFSDTLPDLQRRLGELQDISQRTSTSLEGFVSTSEKLLEVTKSGGITRGQLSQIERERLVQLGGIPNVPGRNEFVQLVGQNRFQEAREVQGNINSILAQRQRVLQSQTQFTNFRKGAFGFSTEGLSSEDKKLFKDFQQSTTDLNRNKDTLRSLQLNNIPSSSKTVKNLEAEIKRIEEQRNKSLENFFNLSDFSQQFRGLSTGLLGLEDPVKRTKSFDILSKTDVTSEAKNVNDITKNLRNAFKGTGTSLETVVDDIAKGLEKTADGFKNSPTFLNELFKRIFDEFKPENFKALADSSKLIEGTAQKSAQTLFALNKSLLESRKQFEALGASIEIGGIKRLSELTSSLDISSIKQRTNNQISSLTGGGERQRSFFDFQENQSAILANLQKSRESLGIKTGQQIFEKFGEARAGLKNSVFDPKVQEKFEGKEEELKERIDKLVGGFDEVFKPFLNTLKSGTPISAQFIKEISNVAEAELERAELTRKSNLLQPKEQAAAEVRIKELNKFVESLIGIESSFGTERAGIGFQAASARNVNSAQFQENFRLLGARRAVDLENLRRTGNFDVSQISRQAELSRAGLGQGFRNKIEISNLKEFESNIGSLFREAINNPTFGGILNNKTVRNTGDLDAIISDQSKLVSGLQNNQGAFPEEEETKELLKQVDSLEALLQLRQKISNLDNLRLENIKQQTIEEEKLLKFAAARIAEQRRINEENSREGNFTEVRKNLGNTFTEAFSFNQNDYFNELSQNVADFGEDFKNAFKNGFAEMATGAKSAGEAFRSIGLNIAGSILTKASGLATDQLFGALLGNQSNLTGGAGLLSGLFTKKAYGGLIIPKKYARGGYVDMGSGVRDDVPALLSGGEFVINKKSTSKLGKSTLDILNESPEKARDIIKTSSSNELNALLANEFFGVGSKTRPTSGSLNSSSLLSDIALTDENNPQNALRFSRERYFFDLKQYQNEIRKARNQFEKQQLTSLYSAYLSAGINFAGSQIGSKPKTPEDYNKLGREFGDLSGGGDLYNSGRTGFSIGRAMGGLILKKYNFGGNVFGGDTKRDNLPALLTGGEFVFNKNASNRIGLENLNYMNKMGQFPGFNEGGRVGNDFISAKGNNNQGNQESSTPAINISNQISITLNDNGMVNNSTNSQVSDNRKGGEEDKNEQGKQVGELIKNMFNELLIKESRQGGKLYERFKTK